MLNIIKKYKKKLYIYKKLLKYRGDKVECLFCEKKFSAFMPTGILNRPFWKTDNGLSVINDERFQLANAKCPFCGSGERHRLLYLYLRDKFKIKNFYNKRILDIAPDIFFKNKIFSKINCQYTSIDTEPQRNPTQIMNLTNLKFSNNYFDIIFCYHVLEHINDDQKAISEIFRVLKPGGISIIQVPVWAEKTLEYTNKVDNELFYGHWDHVRLCGLDYIEKIKKAGFHVNEVQYGKTLSIEDIKKFGIFENEKIWICTKK